MYQILINSDPVELAEEISAASAAGYFPWGDLLVTQVLVAGLPRLQYTQAIIQTEQIDAPAGEPILN